MDLDLCANIAKEITKKAGEIVLEGFYSDKNVLTKDGFADLVTAYDKNVEKYIFSELKNKFPSHKFIGEESTSEDGKTVLTNDPTWIVDPIDGTTNFVHGFPYCAISIGLFHDKKPVFGIVYNPILNECFSAKKGKGAFLNQKKLVVNNTTDLKSALLCTEFGSSRDPEIIDSVLINMKNIVTKAHGVRNLGSAALNMCSVACGRTDAYWEYGIHIWDIAAGSLIVQEAGGFLGNPNGGTLDYMSRRVLCASTKLLASQISSSIQEITFERD